MTNRRFDIYDTALVLRAHDAAALSATTAGAGVDVGAESSKNLAVVIDVAAYTGYTATSAEWTIAVESRDSADANQVVLQSFVTNGTKQQFRVPLDAPFVLQRHPASARIGVRATKTGSPGNLSYGAYVTANP